ncbi:tol-pal system protein YbgF [Lacibacterium aquatile]|uniref:Cell division coordinator CpoB n=1 Tax=Lacibacterium aquatile TaxID=1168082 RepID=A0ABW5DR37_9PROT
MRHARLFSTAALAGLLLAPAVFADDLTALQRANIEAGKRLAVLQSEAEVLLAQVPPTADIPVTAQLTIRIQQLEGEIRQLTGQIEEQSYNLQQLKVKQERFQTDAEFRLSELEKHATAPAADAAATAPAAPARPLAPGQLATTPAPAAVAPGAPPRDLGSIPAGAANAPVRLTPPGTAQTAAVPPAAAAPAAAAPAAAAVRLPAGTTKQQYEYAFEFVKKQEYGSAESALRQFVTNNPNDELAGNAQYWLGETYYVRGSYADAAQQFLTGYQKYPKSPKAPDNLLKLGLSLANTGKTKEACAAYGRFTSEYGNASEFLMRRVREERQRLACT